MAKHTDAEYEALVERLHQPGAVQPSSHALYGDAAVVDSQHLLMRATGTHSIDDATRVALGRPRLDAESPGPLWKVRTTKALDDKVRTIAEQLGITRSEVIRAAVNAYSVAIEDHSPVS